MALRYLILYMSRRLAWAVGTLLVVSIIVFAATEVLPGNVVYAMLGHTATPVRVKQLSRQLGLDQGLWAQYWHWFSRMVVGNFGISLVNGHSVWSALQPKLVDSSFLLVAAGILGSLVGIGLGVVASLRRGGLVDQALAVGLLAIVAMPEFVVAAFLVLIFATNIAHILPAVSVFPAGANAWTDPRYCILPTIALVVIVVPYISRMTRAAMVEVLESDYIEFARLKGLGRGRIIRHALPNALGPVVQVVGLTLLYLAGGIVVVEYFFAFPGIGQGLVNAVTDRDIPVIQATVLILTLFYVVVNICVDVAVLVVTPGGRRRVMAR
jgi:peptide/nickel transport system permease protein